MFSISITNELLKKLFKNNIKIYLFQSHIVHTVRTLKSPAQTSELKNECPVFIFII